MDIALDDWYRPEIDRKELRRLMRRSDARGLARVGGLLALTAATGGVAYLSIGSWWAVPAFLLYGTIFAFSEAAQHEISHGTAFRSRWLNETALFIVCFMSWREPLYSRYRHARHHTFTSMLGGDVEGEAVRPKSPVFLATEGLLRLRHGWVNLGAMLRHSFGVISETDRAMVPEPEHSRMCWNARALVAAYGAIFIWAIAAASWLPLLFLFLPRCYGTWLHDLCSRTQHAGLALDVKDHRLTTRTVLMGPVLRYLYWNMNYHIEHHVFPNVPFHALPTLHERVKDQLPAPSVGLRGAWREMMAVFLRQRRLPDYHLTPALPSAWHASI